jgi:hypothetical protein
MALPRTAAQRSHECGAGWQLAGTIRELLG